MLTQCFPMFEDRAAVLAAMHTCCLGQLIATGIGLGHAQALGAMQPTMVLQLLGVLEPFATLRALVVALLGVNFGVRVHQPRVDGRLEAAQLTAVELHVDLMCAPEMRVQAVPIAELCRPALGADHGLS